MKLYYLAILLSSFIFTFENENKIIEENKIVFENISKNYQIKPFVEHLIYVDSLYAKENEPYLKNLFLMYKGGLIRENNVKEAKEIFNQTNSFISNKSDLLLFKLFNRTLKISISIKENKVSEEEIVELKKNIFFLDKNIHLKKILSIYEWNISLLINAYILKNQKEKALQELEKIENKLKENENLDFKIYISSQIGLIHYILKNYQEAIKYYQNSISLIEKNNYKPENIYATVKINLSKLLFELNKKEEAITILNNLLLFTKTNKLNYYEAKTNLLLANYFIKQNKIQKAKEFLNESLIIFSKLNDDEGLKSLYYLSSIVLFEEKKYDDALNDINSYLKLQRKKNNSNNIDIYINGLIFKKNILVKKNNHHEALIISDTIIHLMDSLKNNNEQAKLQEILINHETTKKEKEILKLKHKNELNKTNLELQNQNFKFLIILTLILIFIGLSIWYYQKKINKIKNLRYNSKLIRSQFNPHYINNAFTSLQATLIEHDLDESLINYTSDISRFSRLLLESTFKEEWTLFEEKQMMENYLKTQQHRYENNFEFTIFNNFSNDELNQFILPSALTQTVLENAIEHGGYQNNKGGKIEISIQKKNNQIEIVIKNNKVGSEKSSPKNLNNEPSRGLEITKQRIDLHQKIHKTKTEFRFNKQENEVLVTFVLPLLNN